MTTLVKPEKGSVRIISVPDLVIEGLTKCVHNRVVLLSAFSSDKELHREMNEVLGFLIHKESQNAITSFEAWLNRAIEILEN